MLPVGEQYVHVSPAHTFNILAHTNTFLMSVCACICMYLHVLIAKYMHCFGPHTCTYKHIPEHATSTTCHVNCEVKLLRGVGPHLHPRRRAAGWFGVGPAPPALDSSRRVPVHEGLELATRGLQRPGPLRGLRSPDPWCPRSRGLRGSRGACRDTGPPRGLSRARAGGVLRRGSRRVPSRWHPD